MRMLLSFYPSLRRIQKKCLSFIKNLFFLCILSSQVSIILNSSIFFGIVNVLVLGPRLCLLFGNMMRKNENVKKHVREMRDVEKKEKAWVLNGFAFHSLFFFPTLGKFRHCVPCWNNFSVFFRFVCTIPICPNCSGVVSESIHFSFKVHITGFNSKNMKRNVFCSWLIFGHVFPCVKFWFSAPCLANYYVLVLGPRLWLLFGKKSQLKSVFFIVKKTFVRDFCSWFN